MQIFVAAAGDLHRHVGTMTRFRLTHFDPHDAVRAADALLTGQNEECLRARMRVDRRHASPGTGGFVDLKKILRCLDATDRSHFRDFGSAAG